VRSISTGGLSGQCAISGVKDTETSIQSVIPGAGRDEALDARCRTDEEIDRRVADKRFKPAVYADIFDYIERFHNRRRCLQMEMNEANDLLSTQPSVEMPVEPAIVLARESCTHEYS
jgi:hypothetical protein